MKSIKILLISAAALSMFGTVGAAQTAPQAQSVDSDPLWQTFRQARDAHNKQAAIDALKQGAAKGDLNAIAQLGEEYRGDDFELAGVLPVDYRKAFALSKTAADRGNAHAMYGLGMQYMRGNGVPKDYKRALSWFLKASQAGDKKSPREVGLIYEHGDGTRADAATAARYYTKAAALGDITGQCLLGSLYERGRGVPRSYDRAETLYGQSAQRGDLVASAGMEALGNLYETRNDGKRNVATAIGWYRKAADLQNPVAKADLARLTATNPPPLPAGRSLCLSPFPQ